MEVETFPALKAIPGLVHGFTCREPGLDVAVGRSEAVSRLGSHWDKVVPSAAWGAEQVHGKEIGIVRPDEDPRDLVGVDGLVAGAGSYLKILVADCAAVFVVDPVLRCCGLFHSGRKGTELGIVPDGVSMLDGLMGSDPRNLIVQVAPCIRPPLYEVDFVAKIREDCLAAGILEEHFHDVGTCTGRNVDRYYSYRVEKGKTGRMLAFLGFKE